MMKPAATPPNRSIYADDDLMKPLLVEFTARLSEHVVAIRNAIAAENGAALRNICHQLKGAGKSYGFAPISTHAADVEQKLKANLPLSDVYGDVNALLDYIERVEGYQAL